MIGELFQDCITCSLSMCEISVTESSANWVIVRESILSEYISVSKGMREWLTFLIER